MPSNLQNLVAILDHLFSHSYAARATALVENGAESITDMKMFSRVVSHFLTISFEESQKQICVKGVETLGPVLCAQSNEPHRLYRAAC